MVGCPGDSLTSCCERVDKMLLHLFRSLSCWSLALQQRYRKCTDFFHASVFHARVDQRRCAPALAAPCHCVIRSVINELRRKLQRTRQSFVVYIQNANSLQLHHMRL